MPKREILEKQLQHCITETNFDFLGHKFCGKIRDNYTQEFQGKKRRFLITTDKLSAFDRIITTIPFKGQVLNETAKFWFENTKDIVKSHAEAFPDPNITVGEECEVFPVEFVVRGYITGSTSTSAWVNYGKGIRNFCGHQLPDGMRKNEKFQTPIVTPSTKAEKGGHDESVSRAELLDRGVISAQDFDTISEIALKLFTRGTEIAARQGLILADTKYEFGKNSQNEIILVDEIHTPDSSRYWFASEYEKRLQEGLEQKTFDKEFLRLWLKTNHNYAGEGEVPFIPESLRLDVAEIYITAYEMITGLEFQAKNENPINRMEQNLRKFLGE
jgi:phosphoribosylaminoimidazole-succinocarboxamide synthase